MADFPESAVPIITIDSTKPTNASPAAWPWYGCKIALMTMKMITRLICESSSSISFSNHERKRGLVERSMSSAPAIGASASRMMICTSRAKLFSTSSRMITQSTRNRMLEPILRSPTS